jgi:hypothetical protein
VLAALDDMCSSTASVAINGTKSAKAEKMLTAPMKALLKGETMNYGQAQKLFEFLTDKGLGSKTFRRRQASINPGLVRDL